MLEFSQSYRDQMSNVGLSDSHPFGSKTALPKRHPELQRQQASRALDNSRRIDGRCRLGSCASALL